MELSLVNNITNTISNKIEDLQEKFLGKSWGEAINNAVDTGLKMILPDFIENEIIEIKDGFIKGGLIEGIKGAIDVTVRKGKELTGMVTGNLENMTQAEAIMKNGDLIGNIANMLGNVIDNSIANGFVRDSLGKLVKSGEDIILDYAEKNLDKVNKEQVKKTKEIDEAIQNWHEAYERQDFRKMSNEFRKIENRIDEIMPLEDIITKARTVENLHNLIKNNDKRFDLTEDQLKLAEQLV